MLYSSVYFYIIKVPESVTTEDVTDLAAYDVAADSVIAYLVKNDADPNARDAYGSTPLHFAAMRENEVALLDLLCMKGIIIEVSSKFNSHSYSFPL